MVDKFKSLDEYRKIFWNRECGLIRDKIEKDIIEHPNSIFYFDVRDYSIRIDCINLLNIIINELIDLNYIVYIAKSDNYWLIVINNNTNHHSDAHILAYLGASFNTNVPIKWEIEQLNSDKRCMVW